MAASSSKLRVVIRLHTTSACIAYMTRLHDAMSRYMQPASGERRLYATPAQALPRGCSSKDSSLASATRLIFFRSPIAFPPYQHGPSVSPWSMPGACLRPRACSVGTVPTVVVGGGEGSNLEAVFHAEILEETKARLIPRHKMPVVIAHVGILRVRGGGGGGSSLSGSLTDARVHACTICRCFHTHGIGRTQNGRADA